MITMKKKSVIDNKLPYLCEEIIVNILKCLPAKSLIRFQCACKDWKNLIKSPSFIDNHFHHSTCQKPCLLFQPFNSKGPLSLDMIDCDMQVLRVPNHPLIDYFKCGCVVGSSNGLLCVDISNELISHRSLLLCNPATREVIQVPTTCTDLCGSLGFGFSPFLNDYKIVKIYVDVMFHGLPEKVEVYSLKTRSWKQVELGILNYASISSASSTANGNGAIFWFGFKLDEDDEIGDLAGGIGNNVIISFDILREVFRFLPMPTSACRSHLNRLTTYANNLAMLSYSRIENSKSSLIDLWVMEEGSWTKKYTSNPYPCLLRPMTIWKNEIVCSISTRLEMENDNPNNTVFFNLTTKEFKEFAVSRSHCGHRIFNYVESLVPIGGVKLSAMDM